MKESERARPSAVEGSPTKRASASFKTNPYIAEINGDTLLVDKTSFVAFICKTVNVAMQQNRKGDIIKTLEAAVEITAELLHEMLNPNYYDGVSLGNQHPSHSNPFPTMECQKIYCQWEKVQEC